MIEKLASEITSPKLADTKYRDRVFKLLWIQSINTVPGENLFKVLYRDVRTGMYLTDTAAPELLTHFSIGSYHQNGKLMAISPEGLEIDVTVESTEKNPINKISECVTDKQYNLNHSFQNDKSHVDFTAENKRQFCIEMENKQQTIIFPCSAIASAFYFLSKSMREQLFAGNLKGLYEKIEIDPSTKKATILMKPGAANKDAPHIVRFAKSHFAYKRWMAISNSIRSERQKGEGPFIPLKADFPAKGPFVMTVRGLRFPGHNMNKECILVFQIIKVKSPFDFRGLEVVRREAEAQNLDKVTISTNEHETTDVMTDKTPTSNLSSATILDEIGEIDESVQEMGIEYSHIPSENERESDGIVVHHAQNSPVDMSTLSPDRSGDEETRQGSTVRANGAGGTKEKESFGLEDFAAMVQELRKIEGVSNFELYGPFSVPLVHRDEKNYSLREVYDKEDKRRRKYHYATFTYRNFGICLIEIDQSKLPQGCATYVLKSNIKHPLGSEAETVVLKPFIGYVKIETIAENAKRKGITFLSKRHPLEKGEEHYKKWAADLLRLFMQ